MNRFGDGFGYLRGVTSGQFWFVVVFGVLAACLFLGVLRYAEEEATREPTEQEKEEFWQRLAEKKADDRVIIHSK